MSDNVFLAISMVVLALILLYSVRIYNRLVAARESIKQAFKNIDVILAQRNNEIPKLVESARAYMAYEKEVFERIIEARSNSERARSSGNLEKMGQSENQMIRGLSGLVALAESNPELKSDQTFSKLMLRISELEETIADRREVYNEAATINNILVQEVPEVFVAKLFNFSKHELLEIEKSLLEDVKIKSLFEQ